MSQKMTYQNVGVDYDAMDPFKRQATKMAVQTSRNVERFGIREVSMSRGESAFLIDCGDHYLAHVEEGLGTKNLVADAMRKLTGKNYYHRVAQDTVAMIVNDMITLGALPLSVAMHLAVGDSAWFEDESRSNDLIAGWEQACTQARCIWGGGETPTLKGVVVPGTVVLAGSAIGIIDPMEKLVDPHNIQAGDAIVLVESSGIHANGLTMARKIADKLPDGYLTMLSDGHTYGETLLTATHIYVPAVEECQKAGIDLHYLVNITGHGWRKLMRATQPFTYVIETLPTQQPLFDFIQENGPVDDEEAYGNFNMGAGFALFVSEKQAQWVVNIINGSCPYRALIAGRIENGPKQVVLEPKNLVYEGETLGVR